MNWYIMVFNINGLKGKEMLLAFMWNVACIYVTLLSHFICSISFSFFALWWIWWRQYNQMAHPSMHFESLNHFFEEESNDSFTSTSFYCSTTPYHKKKALLGSTELPGTCVAFGEIKEWVNPCNFNSLGHGSKIVWNWPEII